MFDLLGTERIHNTEIMLTNLYSEFAELWIKACELENADPTSIGVELSDSNPHRKKLAELNSQVHQYEHTLRYLYLRKARRDALITGAY